MPPPNKAAQPELQKIPHEGVRDCRTKHLQISAIPTAVILIFKSMLYMQTGGLL